MPSAKLARNKAIHIWLRKEARHDLSQALCVADHEVSFISFWPWKSKRPTARTVRRQERFDLQVDPIVLAQEETVKPAVPFMGVGATVSGRSFMQFRSRRPRFVAGVSGYAHLRAM